MEFSTILLFVIACVITIYFTWNIVNYYNRPRNTKHEPDIRYYELKSKYEFLVAVVSLVTAIAVFYGLGTKKDIEQNIKSGINSQLEPTQKRVAATDAKVDTLNNSLKDAQKVITAYYSALKEIESKQQLIDNSSQKSQGKFEEFQKRIDTLNAKNILKRNFYPVDNLRLDFNKMARTKDNSATIKFDTLLTTLGDKLPLFKKPPIIISVSDVGFALHIFNVTNASFKIMIEPQWFDEPKNGIVIGRLLITEVE